MQQRHLLRPARRPARVQEQRDVVGAAGIEGLRGLYRAPPDCQPRRFPPGDDDVDDPHSGSCCLPRRVHLACRQEQETRVEVAEVEGVLVLRVRRVQRRGSRAEEDDPEEDLDELAAVRKDDGDPVAPIDADRAEPAGDLQRCLLEFGERVGAPVLRRDQRCPLLLGRAREERRERLAGRAHAAQALTSGSSQLPCSTCSRRHSSATSR